MVVERVRAVLDNSRAKGNVLGGALKRSDRARTHGCAPRIGFSLREIARRKGAASGVLQILRRVESGVNT